VADDDIHCNAIVGISPQEAYMNNTHPVSAHHQSNQPKLLLAQTHRVIQCDINPELDHSGNAGNSNMDSQPAKQHLAENAQGGRWQQLLQRLKKIILPGLLTLSTVLLPQAQARDVSISVQGQIQPGVYGQIQVGQPAVRVYQQPVYREPVYVYQDYAPQYAPQTVYVQTVLVQAPKKHRKHWKKYCHHYGACQQRVQFVEVDYRPRQYEKVYVYHERDHGRREEKRHYHRGHD
jgi:hypothetical protein